MALVNPQELYRGEGTRIFKYASVDQNSTFGEIDTSGYPIHSMNVVGTFGGATFNIGGSNDAALGGTYVNLRAVHTNAAMAITTNDLQEILEHCHFLKPAMSGAGAGTAITIWVLLNTTRR